jgi:hypothetical protein
MFAYLFDGCFLHSDTHRLRKQWILVVFLLGIFFCEEFILVKSHYQRHLRNWIGLDFQSIVFIRFKVGRSNV